MACPAHLLYTVIGEGHTSVEFYVNLICPFAGMTLKTISNGLIPQVLPGGKYHGKVKILFRLTPHVWHPQGCYNAEMALGFGKAFCTEPCNPELWFTYLCELNDRQVEFYDHQVQDETPNQVKERLIDIAGDVIERTGGVASIATTKEEAISVLKASMQLNDFKHGGTHVIFDQKYMSKMVRQNGIFISPSVLVDGILDSTIQSKWTETEWQEWLENYLANSPFTH